MRPCGVRLCVRVCEYMCGSCYIRRSGSVLSISLRFPKSVVLDPVLCPARTILGALIESNRLFILSPGLYTCQSAYIDFRFVGNTYFKKHVYPVLAFPETTPCRFISCVIHFLRLWRNFTLRLLFHNCVHETQNADIS